MARALRSIASGLVEESDEERDRLR
jgi:hypothetical protein